VRWEGGVGWRGGERRRTGVDMVGGGCEGRVVSGGEGVAVGGGGGVRISGGKEAGRTGCFVVDMWGGDDNGKGLGKEWGDGGDDRGVGWGGGEGRSGRGRGWRGGDGLWRERKG